MQKIFIENRKQQKLSVLIEKADAQKGLAFVMHGLGGFKEQPHIETFTRAFQDNKFTTVRFDTTNTFGESDGNYEDATTTNYYEDLEDVIAWASGQDFYQEPFWLAGHSLGGISCALYAGKYPLKVGGLAPISTVVSGALSIESKTESGELQKWRRTGWRETPSESKPGVIKRLKWSHMEDRMQYDLLPEAGKLTMPVLLIVGSVDTSTPTKHQKVFYDTLPEPKELHVIENSPHTFRDPIHLQQIYELFDQWIKKHAIS